MNFWNFAKVIIARATKDTGLLEWFRNGQDGPTPIPSHHDRMTAKLRHEAYINITDRYEKMQLPLDVFRDKVKVVQKYLTKNMYYKNGNKSGETNTFLTKFSLTAWLSLSEQERKQYQVIKCSICEGRHLPGSSLLKSNNESVQQVINSCEDLVEAIQRNESSTEAIQTILNTINPMIKEKLNLDPSTEIAKHMKMTQK